MRAAAWSLPAGPAGAFAAGPAEVEVLLGALLEAHVLLGALLEVLILSRLRASDRSAIAERFASIGDGALGSLGAIAAGRALGRGWRPGSGLVAALA